MQTVNALIEASATTHAKPYRATCRKPGARNTFAATAPHIMAKRARGNSGQMD